ncbi:hypothetical protein N7495_008229 [Penicillium taxi]|uniref:uncharacterized protein n=1 Tax=Penicillium taxi TaxID=168475 RepID=UPI0025451D76|nr:uncharacterized protein N7495_008229 [Penicillium taxi]KAJ5888188.1 hypothetical protein N7495_008229 [Penicillium taxi]
MPKKKVHGYTKSTELPPPPYSEENPLTPTNLPKLNLNRNADQNSDSSDLVTPDQCVAHLKLLAVLADLRDTISGHNGLFGIYNSIAERFEPQDQRDRALARIREKRWTVYTARAVDRYEKWWSSALPSSRCRLTITDMMTPNFEDIVDPKSTLTWKNPPPIDVLMVLHSHMLNPRDFLQDCLIHGKMSLWKAGFPFELVNNCINDDTLEYTVSQGSQTHFSDKVGLNWDNILDPLVKYIECPGCHKTLHVLWTWNKRKEGATPDELFKLSTGYADTCFKEICLHCKIEVDHGRLRVRKFWKDINDNIARDYPMPGSILNIKGMPENLAPDDYYKTWPKNVMNRLIYNIGKKLAVYTDPTEPRDMSDIRSDIQAKLTAYSDRYQIFGPKSLKNPLKGDNKVYFQRTMTHYWENFSLFGLDLVGAVIRQGTFVQKMDNIDWLHAPTVMETAQRLISKYTVFMNIMISNRGEMAVPTLDIDLAWHTHQLMPQRYYRHTTSKSGYFINHDDKIEETQLSKAFEWTSKMYRRATNGEVYSACTCWYCEAVRVPDIYDGILRSIGSTSRAAKKADALHETVSSDPEKNPHISAHNAVRPVEEAVRQVQSTYLYQLYLKQNYAKAFRRSQKRQRLPLPSKTDAEGGSSSTSRAGPDYATPLVWGLPINFPYYAPYMCDPGISPGTYVENTTAVQNATSLDFALVQPVEPLEEKEVEMEEEEEAEEMEVEVEEMEEVEEVAEVAVRQALTSIP